MSAGRRSAAAHIFGRRPYAALVLAFLWVFAVPAGVAAQQRAAMAGMELSKVRQEYGTAAAENGDVVLHAPAVVRIALDGKAVSFRTQAGIRSVDIDGDDPDMMFQPLSDGRKLVYRRDGDGKRFVGLTGSDGTVGTGSAVLTLKADGKTVYGSCTLRGGAAPVQVDADLTGVRMLEIVLDTAEDGASGDMVVLAAPVVTYGGEAPEITDAAASGAGPQQDGAVVARLGDKIAALPVWESVPSDRTPFDWLLTPEKSRAGIYRTADGKSIVVANGMVARTLRIFPNLATTHLTNRMTVRACSAPSAARDSSPSTAGRGPWAGCRASPRGPT